MKLRPHWQLVLSDLDRRSARRVMRGHSCHFDERLWLMLGLMHRELLVATVIWRRVVVRTHPARAPLSRASMSPALVGWLSPTPNGGCVFRWRISPPVLSAVLMPALAFMALLFSAALVFAGSSLALFTSIGLTIWLMIVFGLKRWTDDVRIEEDELLSSWVKAVTAELTRDAGASAAG